MNYISLFFYFFLINQIVGFPQSCLPYGITFSNQSDIDNFQTNHPNCSQIEGSVIICGNNINNLNGLSVLTSIDGNLDIQSNQSLYDLDGLNNITIIGGSLDIDQNGNLESIAGLINLTSIGENLTIKRNYNLDSLYGLNSITNINGYVAIKYNNSLLNLSGLDNLTSVGGGFGFGYNDALENVNNLGNLTSIGEYFFSSYNATLINFEGMENLTSIGGAMHIQYNSSLTALTGLDNIDSWSISHLYIFHNPVLSLCEVQSVCDFLAVHSLNYVIQNNATGCNSDVEVKEACEILGIKNLNSNPDFSIYPNPTKDILFISNTHETSVYEIKIYDNIGQKVFHEHQLSNTIDVSFLHQGLYIIEVSTHESRIRKKMIIK